MVAKKAAAKRTTAKKTVAKTARPAKTGDPAEGLVSPLEDVGRDVLAGKYGTGRERDIALRAAGHDPAKVQKETARLAAQPKDPPQT